MAKKCIKCKIDKDLSEYYVNKQSKDGYRNNCKTCEKDRKKRYYSKPEIKAKEKIKKAEYRSLSSNKEIAKVRARRWYYDNIDRVKSYQKENRKRILANNAKYRAKKLNATLPNFDDEIKQVYEECPKGYHVDHIIPLQHSKVCGLHVPWNLQHLPAKENISKSNKLMGELDG